MALPGCEDCQRHSSNPGTYDGNSLSSGHHYLPITKVNGNCNDHLISDKYGIYSFVNLIFWDNK